MQQSNNKLPAAVTKADHRPILRRIGWLKSCCQQLSESIQIDVTPNFKCKCGIFFTKIWMGLLRIKLKMMTCPLAVLNSCKRLMLHVIYLHPILSSCCKPTLVEEAQHYMITVPLNEWGMQDRD